MFHTVRRKSPYLQNWKFQILPPPKSNVFKTREHDLSIKNTLRRNKHERKLFTYKNVHNLSHRRSITSFHKFGKNINTKKLHKHVTKISNFITGTRYNKFPHFPKKSKNSIPRKSRREKKLEIKTNTTKIFSRVPKFIFFYLEEVKKKIRKKTLKTTGRKRRSTCPVGVIVKRNSTRFVG